MSAPPSGIKDYCRESRNQHNQNNQNKIVDIEDKRLMAAQYYCYGISYFYFSNCLILFVSMTFVWWG